MKLGMRVKVNPREWQYRCKVLSGCGQERIGECVTLNLIEGLIMFVTGGCEGSPLRKIGAKASIEVTNITSQKEFREDCEKENENDKQNAGHEILEPINTTNHKEIE